MPSGELNYSAEVPGMVEDMRRIVGQVNQEMDTLGQNVNSLAGSSKSQAVGSYQDVHRQWGQLMDQHNQVLGNVAVKVNQGFNRMISFDQQSANQIRQA